MDKQAETRIEGVLLQLQELRDDLVALRLGVANQQTEIEQAERLLGEAQVVLGLLLAREQKSDSKS